MALGEEEWFERMISNLTEIWLEKIKRGRLEEHERIKISDLSRLKVFNKLEIIAPGYMTMDNVETICTEWVVKKDVRLSEILWKLMKKDRQKRQFDF